MGTEFTRCSAQPIGSQSELHLMVASFGKLATPFAGYSANTAHGRDVSVNTGFVSI